MRLSILLLSTAAGLASARIRPYMYGVPMAPGTDINDVAEIQVLAASNSTTNTTEPRPTTAPIANSTTGSVQPCAVISSSLQAMPSGARKVVPAELGLQCLQSVPLDKDGNIKLIDDLKLYLAWQSNLAYLKNPPTDYTEAPVDLIGEMESMQRQVASGGYSSEYDFQLDLNTLFNRAYDNHLSWNSDILAGVMQFQRPAGTELVSVSEDGEALPQIYSYRDLLIAKNDTSFNPSPLRSINGQGVEEYLQTVAPQADFHDANTRWNALFPSQSLIASGVTFLGSFRTGKYQGPSTTMAFANGTVMSAPNVAVVFGNFTGVNSGQTFFQKFCTGPTPTPSVAAAAPTSPPAAPPTPSHIGYPKAIILHPNLSVGGYWINESAYEDVAVLSIPSYDSPDVQLFQNVMRTFIRQSKAAGKTKLIFDLRGNGGGNAILGYDSFKQVFPQADQEPFGGTRYRANEALNIWGQVTSDFNDGNTYAQKNTTAFAEAFGALTQNDVFLYTIGQNYQHQLDVENQKIPSWPEMFGPERLNNDSFTSVIRYNFSDQFSYTYPGFSVIGFLNNTNETTTPQPFKSEDIVMLHDGMCSSTCTIVSELLKNQGGVRTIAVGGQPQVGPMQGIAGTKGAQNWEWDDIQIRSQIIYFLGSPEQQAEWNKTSLGPTAFATQLFKRSAYSGGRAAGGINLRDNMRRDDASKTPLEFIYEAADCRMYYTAPMINDVTMVWKGVVDRMWKNGTCVTGSTGDKSSVSAGGQEKEGQVPTPPITPTPPAPQGEQQNTAARVRDMGGLGWLGAVIAVMLCM